MPLPEDLSDPRERIRKIRELKKKMEEEDKRQINQTDTDCGLMKTRKGFEASTTVRQLLIPKVR